MDLYIVLGVAREATTADIKRAYRRLARRLHPDINPGDGEAAARFRQIVDAYETLVDPDRRRMARLSAIDDIRQLARRRPYPRVFDAVETLREQRRSRGRTVRGSEGSG